MFTSTSPNPFFARCAFSDARASAAFMSGTRRRSIFATALCGNTVFPPGPVYPPTSPSMLTVGRDASISSASGQDASPIHRETPSCFFAAASSRRREASATMAFSAAEIGRALSANPSIAGVFPSGPTSVWSAWTRCHAGLSTRALLLEWMSLSGPRPHFSPVTVSSHSMTPLAPSAIVTTPSGPWAAEGMKTPVHRDSAFATSGLADDLRKVRRADLLLALGDEDEVDRELHARAAVGMDGGEERRLGALLVHGAAAHEDLPEPGLVDDRRVEGRRGPFRGIDLLDVVHEVDADGSRRPGVERPEHAGLSVRRDAHRALEAGVREHADEEVAALVHPPVFGGDRRLAHPGLEPRDRIRVALVDLGVHAREVPGRGGCSRARWPRQRRRRRSHALDEFPSIHSFLLFKGGDKPRPLRHLVVAALGGRLFSAA